MCVNRETQYLNIGHFFENQQFLKQQERENLRLRKKDLWCGRQYLSTLRKLQKHFNESKNDECRR